LQLDGSGYIPEIDDIEEIGIGRLFAECAASA